MGRITRVLNHIGNLIKADRSGGDINEMEHLQPHGDDAKPLPQDDGWSDRTSKNGNDVYLGAFDYENKIAEPGEKRIYARNADGDPVNQVYLKKDGEIISSNDNCSITQKPDGTIIGTNGSGTTTNNPDGSIESVNSAGFIKLLSDGSVNINGFIITPAGAATSPVSVGAPLMDAATSLLIAGKEQADHSHLPGTYIDAEARPITGESGTQP